MKKTLAAVAVLGAFAGSALAADVTVYGRLDTALTYVDSEKTTLDGTTDAHSFSMNSGASTGSRIGIKGSEKINDDLTVGFVLEKGIKSDSGKNGDNDRAFDRESTIYAKTNYGTVYAGRLHSLWSDGGSMAWWQNYAAFGSGNDVASAAGMFVKEARVDNRISYKSPVMGGFTVMAEYAFGGDGATENTSQNNRPASLAVRYQAGALDAGLALQYVNEKSFDGTKVTEQEDQYLVGLGATYNFGVAKLMTAAQYFKNADSVGFIGNVIDSGKTFEELEGYGLSVGANVPAWGGNWVVGAVYVEAEDKAEAQGTEFAGYEFGVTYYYPLTKQFRVYAGAGYQKTEAEKAGTTTHEYEAVKAMVGTTVYF